jgi:ketosteroid isomerase-like protein
LSNQKPIFSTAQDAEAAFYEAIERADLEAMMAVWAEDEEIVCIHPGGPRLAGYSAIREAWKRIFENNARMSMRVVHQSHLRSPFVAVHSLMEYVSLRNDDTVHAPLVATNIYLRGPLGWRLAVHHASPAPADVSPDTSKTLH